MLRLKKENIGDHYFSQSTWSSLWIRLLIGNVIVWCLAIIILQFIPSEYLSKGSISVTGIGSQEKVFLPNAGQATSGDKNESPYNYIETVDPRENYMYIALDEVVLRKASSNVGMSLDDFGEPEVKLIEGTTIIEFSLGGKTPKEAQEKAKALYQALYERVVYLRKEELQSQQATLKKSSVIARKNLLDTKQRLYEFTSKSPLKTIEQVNYLSEQIETLKAQRSNILSQKNAVNSRILQTSENLNLSGQNAKDALILLDDPIFQKYLEEYSNSITQLQVSSGSLTQSNPLIVQETAKREQAWNAVRDRGYVLLKKTVDRQVIDQLSLKAEGERQGIAKDLLSQKADQKSLMTQVKTLDQEVRNLSSQLQTLSQEKLKLDRLQQNEKLAESIFLSKVAQLNIEKPDYATSYPPLQLIAAPALPEEDESRSRRTFILGILAITLLGTTGIITFFWNRDTDTKSESLSEDKIYLNGIKNYSQEESSELNFFPAEVNIDFLETYSAWESLTQADEVQEVEFRKTNMPSLSILQLEEIANKLQKNWSYSKQFIEEQEEEMHLLCSTINALESEISLGDPKRMIYNNNLKPHQIVKIINEENERKRLLEESLIGQRVHLEKQQNRILLYQQILHSIRQDAEETA
jgi:uncharacterized protein involved in exopolysaccharide biosynthesis